MTTGRPVLQAPLDEDTHAAFREFCRVHGVTMSAMVEVFAREAAGHPRLPAWLAALVDEARQVAWERRSRD